MFGLFGRDVSAADTELAVGLADLEQRLDRLEMDELQWSMSSTRARAIGGLIHDVLDDASQQASWLNTPALAGYDGNAYIGSADGAFLMRVSGLLQHQFVWSHQDADSGDGDRAGFATRRLRVKAYGHVVDPSLKYSVQVDVLGGSGLTIYLEKDLGELAGGDLAIRFGRFKPPLLHEQLLGITSQLAVDRSLLDAEFGQIRTQGFGAKWTSETIRLEAMVSNGIRLGSLATVGFPGTAGVSASGALRADTEYALTGRVSWKPSGSWKWKTFRDFTSLRGDEPGVMLGVAGHWQRGESGLTAGSTETVTLTGDISMEFGGSNLFAAVIYRRAEAAGLASLDQIGAMIQGGVFVTDDWEVFGRYEYGDFDVAGVEDMSVVTIGATRYVDRHRLKWTTDIGYALDPIDGVWASGGLGYRPDAPDEDGQIVVRSQVQLQF